MRICTYNIHGGLDEARKKSLGVIAESLLEIQPDLCLLQEVDRFLPRSGFVDQAQWLAQRLGAQCHFYGRLRVARSAFGNAILTRLPVESVRRLPLPGSGEPRCALGLVLEGGIEVWNAHLGLDEAVRARQIATLEAALGGGAVLLGGDFNAGPDEPALKAFLERAGFTSLVPPENTFPLSSPRHRIDYLLGRGLTGTGATVAAPGSDHCLVWADATPPAPSPRTD